MPSVVEVLLKTEGYLKSRAVDSPRLDAELLVAHVLGLDRMALYLRHDQPLVDAELASLRELVARRGRREPLAWIVGHRAFYKHDFEVRPGVLVPRPDSETLVEAALEVTLGGGEGILVDVGTGSGAIGLSVLAERPSWRLFAVDLSTVALDCTRANAVTMGLSERVATVRGSLLEPVPVDRAVDVVVSNPPYIATAVLAGLAPEVRDHEPRLALDGGSDGLDVYRALVPAAAARARRALVLEIGHDQAAAVVALCEQAGLVDLRVVRDLGGRDRVVVGRRAA